MCFDAVKFLNALAYTPSCYTSLTIAVTLSTFCDVQRQVLSFNFLITHQILLQQKQATLLIVYITLYESKLQTICSHCTLLFLFSHAETSCSLSLTENVNQTKQTRFSKLSGKLS